MMKWRGPNKRGFTYFELIGVIALLTVTLAISIVSIRSPKAKRQADSAGKVLLSALQSARAESIAKNMPVAIALAVEDQEAASGFYTLEGHLKPRVVAATDLSREFSDVYVANVVWGTPTDPTIDVGEGFLQDAWLAPRPEDPTLIFLPSGNVVSNGLQLQDNHYTFVLGRGMNLAAGSTPTRVLSGVSDPYTIRVGEHGEMTLSKGLPGGSGLELSSANVPTIGSLPALTPPDNSPPEVLKVSVFPQKAGSSFATVPLEGTLSLQVEAWSPSGAPLFARWTGQGTFSSNEPIPMEWNPVDGLWRGHVEWAAPAGAKAGDEPNFDVVISSTNGEAAAAGKAQKPSIAVAPSSRKIIYSIEVPTNLQDPNVCCSYETQLRQVYDDGSGDRLLANSGGTNVVYSGFDSLDFSPDGSKYLAYHWAEDLDYTNYRQSIKLGLEDAGPVSDFITDTNGNGIWGAKWSPNGTKVSFHKNSAIWMAGADGQNQSQVSPNDPNKHVHSTSDWSKDGRYLVYEDHLHTNPPNWWENYEVQVHDTQTGTTTKVDGLYAGSGAFVPGSTKLLVTGYDSAGNAGLFETNMDGTGQTRLVDMGTSLNGWWTDIPVGVSPNGRYVSFHAWPSGETYGLRVYDRTTDQLHVIPDVEPLWGQSQGQWAPDGEPWILAQKYDSGPTGSGSRLVRFRPDGSEMTYVTEHPEGYPYSYIYSADWTK
jgi:type II secretory pathway pseudopilin PulG